MDQSPGVVVVASDDDHTAHPIPVHQLAEHRPHYFRSDVPKDHIRALATSMDGWIEGDESSRSEALTHILDTLAEGLLQGDSTSSSSTKFTVNDLEVFIHHCRKRKWPLQALQVLAWLQRFGGIFPTLAPTAKTYKCVLEVVDGAEVDGEQAWRLFLDMMDRHGQHMVPANLQTFYDLLVRIFCREGRDDLIVLAFDHMGM